MKIIEQQESLSPIITPEVYSNMHGVVAKEEISDTIAEEINKGNLAFFHFAGNSGILGAPSQSKMLNQAKNRSENQPIGGIGDIEDLKEYLDYERLATSLKVIISDHPSQEEIQKSKGDQIQIKSKREVIELLKVISAISFVRLPVLDSVNGEKEISCFAQGEKGSMNVQLLGMSGDARRVIDKVREKTGNRFLVATSANITQEAVARVVADENGEYTELVGVLNEMNSNLASKDETNTRIGVAVINQETTRKHLHGTFPIVVFGTGDRNDNELELKLERSGNISPSVIAKLFEIFSGKTFGTFNSLDEGTQAHRDKVNENIFKGMAALYGSDAETISRFIHQTLPALNMILNVGLENLDSIKDAASFIDLILSMPTDFINEVYYRLSNDTIYLEDDFRVKNISFLRPRNIKRYAAKIKNMLNLDSETEYNIIRLVTASFIFGLIDQSGDSSNKAHEFIRIDEQQKNIIRNLVADLLDERSRAKIIQDMKDDNFMEVIKYLFDLEARPKGGGAREIIKQRLSAA